MKKFWKFISFGVIIMYILLGVYLLVSPRFMNLQKEFKILFSIVLFLYAGWRIVRIINAERERREEDENK